MKIEIKLSIGNREVLKSLLYRLERAFDYVTFNLNEKERTLGCVLPDSTSSTLEAQLNEFVSTFLGASAKLADRTKPQVVFERRASKQELRADLDVRDTHVPGVRWLGPDSASALELIDQLFEEFARRLSAKTVQAPSLISKSDLERCGYLPKELHQVSFLQHEDACLSPAACLTTYPILEGVDLKSEHEAYTMLGTVFRREGGKFSSKHPLERVWEYQVRELVFFGGSLYRDEIKKEYFDFLQRVAEGLDLSCEISSAADLFFHSEQSPLAVHQLLAKSKFEFNCIYDEGGTEQRLALSSFNSHGKQFVDAFQISGSAQDFQSFCIGFGLHRWVQAMMLSHNGIEAIQTRLKETIKNERSRS